MWYDDTTGKVYDRKFVQFYEKKLMRHVQEEKVWENFDRLVDACGRPVDTQGEPYIDQASSAMPMMPVWLMHNGVMIATFT